MKRRLVVLSGISLASLVAAFASCAGDNEDAQSGPPAVTGFPEASTDTAAPMDSAIASDAGCDAADPSCTSHVVTCDEVDWCMATPPAPILHPLMGLWGSSKSDIWAVGSGGTILHYDGTTWTDTPSGVHDTFFAVWGSGPNNVWVSATTDVTLRSTGFQNGTATWTSAPVDSNNPRQVRAIWGTSAANMRVGTAWFSTFIFTPSFQTLVSGTYAETGSGDAGPIWTPVYTAGSPAGGSITSIWGSSATDIWMTGDNSQINSYERGKTMHGTLGDAGPDGGTDVTYDSLTWTSVDSQSNVTFDAVWGSSASDVWAVGAVGTIRHIVPGDIRWEKVDSPTLESLHALWGSSASDIWAVGDSGTILHFDGKSWTDSAAQLPLGTKPNLYSIWGSGPDDIWISGEKVLLHYTGPKGGLKK